MPKSGLYIHRVQEEADVASVGTAFAVDKLHTLTLNTPINRPGKRFSGVITALSVDVKSISGAASVTVRGVIDGVVVLPDTAATINLDIGSTTDGSCVWLAGIPWDSESDSLELFYKVDAGSVTVEASTITWRE